MKTKLFTLKQVKKAIKLAKELEELKYNELDNEVTSFGYYSKYSEKQIIELIKSKS